MISMEALRRDLDAVADPTAAPPMAAYMKHQFEFMGIKTVPPRLATKPTMARARRATGDELMAFAHNCWNEPEREFQYVGADAFDANVAETLFSRITSTTSRL